jgi:hypothetical protein
LANYAIVSHEKQTGKTCSGNFSNRKTNPRTVHAHGDPCVCPIQLEDRPVARPVAVGACRNAHALRLSHLSLRVPSLSWQMMIVFLEERAQSGRVRTNHRIFGAQPAAFALCPAPVLAPFERVHVRDRVRNIAFERRFLRKNGPFFEFSLCLSRACLGKKIVFIYKWLHHTHQTPSAVGLSFCLSRACLGNGRFSQGN